MANAEDTGSHLETGDLGLGRGLKPGALERCDLVREELKANMTVLKVDLANVKTESPVCTSEKLRLGDYDPGTASVKMPDSLGDSHNQPGRNVRLGTSLRQQKIVYEQDLDDIIKKHSEKEFKIPTRSHMKLPANVNSDPTIIEHNSTNGQINEERVQKLLNEAQQEIEVLRQDLELCQKQLHSKYKAIEILQKQAFTDGKIPLNIREAYMLKTAQNRSIKRVVLMNKKLQNEIQKLQFELEYRQSTLMSSQELWADRFDRVCQENLSLGSELESKNESMRKLVAEKMILARERDELLALLDIQERQQFEANRSPASSEDGFYDFTSNELSLLGACHCRVSEPDPCGCAHSAVNIRRDLMRNKDELQRHKERIDEALTATDAYRMAFEEQLSRNSHLLKKMALLSSPPTSGKTMSQSQKVKAALKWLLEQFNEDDPNAYRGTELKNIEDLESQEDDELIIMLVDMVCDTNEALAHQRLATRMLATKTKELEKRLESTVVTDTSTGNREEGASNG